MELQLILVLLIAFLVLGPERMMDLAIKLGEMVRKAKQMWEEVKMQAYIEEVNRKVMEEEEKTEDETEEDIKEEYIPPELEDYVEEDLEYTPEEKKEEEKKDEFGERASASDDALNRTPQGTENKTD